MYLALDPGGTTGWCSFNDEGETIGYGQLSLDELADKIEEWVNEPIHTIIYESFILFSHKAKRQSGSNMPASQAIGMIKVLARRLDAKVVEQEPRIKSLAQKWTQINPPKNHSESHFVDAFNHGAYYLIRAGIRKTALEMEQEEKKNV